MNYFLFDIKDEAFSALVSIILIEPRGGFGEIPEIIRESGYDGLILYLSHSTSVSHYHQAFDSKAFNYLQKGSDDKSLSRFLRVFADALNAAKSLVRQYIVLSCAGEYRQIDIRDIFYFEGTMDHMVCVEYKGGSFHFPSTLQKMDSRLRDRGFVRTHRSFIVAIDAIHSIGSNEVILNNGRKVPVGRSYLSSMKSTIERWKL